MSGWSGRLARLPAGRRSKWVVLVVWILAVVALGGLAGKLTDAQKNDAVTWLPDSAESTQAYKEGLPFGNADQAPVVLIYSRTDGPITPADIQAAAADAAAARQVQGVALASEPIVAQDKQAIETLVQINMGSGGWNSLASTVKSIKDKESPRPAGLSVAATGPAGFAAEMGEAFKGIDGLLLYAAAGVVIVILLATYGPMLWVLPLLAAGIALVVAQAAVYGFTHAGLTVNAQSAAVLTILVFGAGTDYALLLVARYREELRRHEDKHEAMAVALHRAGPAVLASGLTVMIAMLVLLVARMNSTAGMGPVCAIGIAVALAAMLTLLPALLTITGRWVFWPRHPDFGTTDPSSTTGIWARIGRTIAIRPRVVWIVTAAALVVAALGVSGFQAHGVAAKDSFVKQSAAVDGMKLLEQHFDAGTGAPVQIVANAAQADAVVAKLRATQGITAVAPPQVKDGIVAIEGTLTDSPDSKAAQDTIDRVRDAVHAIPGADAKVGGQTATLLDTERASSHDNYVIVPLVLLVVMGILMLLLRSILAPVLLTATVVLSFFAALGISRWLFDLAGFHGADAGLPLLAFVFLVALGIDYNIFLMSRVHEESKTHGTRTGALKGLAATGGVITSAGLVLAGTFAVFTTMPIVGFAEMGILIAVGVLLDTLIVRSILVTSLTLDIGDRIWWPSPLARQGREPEPVLDTVDA
ncbi:MMPL family transporter [Nocardia stercoris]|uniref:SSD domain-containing protein n=1 Tax=Nocardia stercoris TaxID=2483361 RepID=A0A3M2LKR5_9NOCA|nr:MMPL family transporter [Nocardia stercoris]RMI35398.1 hypothetical protein EBN03_03785 [Nocardia stercoris]